MTDAPKIHVVIPSFNRKDHLIRCLQCLARQDANLSVVVSDSGSTDGTVDAIEKCFPEVTHVNGHPGLWWTGAINIGLAHVQTVASQEDYFLLLNDDTEIEPDFLSTMLALAQIGKRIVGAVCVDRKFPTLVIDGGTIVNWWTAKMRTLNVGKSLHVFDRGHVEQVSVLSGRGALYPVSIIEEIGMPAADKLPHYAADYEYSQRCAAHGYDLVVCYDAVVRGDLSATGVHAPATRWSIRAAGNFFFARKSACNLIDRFHFSRLTARNFVSGTVFYFFTVARLVVRYAKPSRNTSLGS